MPASHSKADLTQRQTRGLMVWTILLGMAIPVLIVGLYVLLDTDTTTTIDPQREQLASAIAGVPVQPLTGPLHTVYFSAAPLPTADAPRADGKDTLVWFSATTCADCQRMEGFAYTAVQQFAEDLVFYERPTNRDSSAQRFGVETLPAFVLLDARGQEIGRFGYQPDAPAFSAAISALLK